MPIFNQTDVLIIGAGPAGLAAAQACRSHSREFLIIEMGATVGQRDHRNHRDLGIGVGGSGLYSDGKFSFYPSASALWQLADTESLEKSWQWFGNVMQPYGLVTPPFPIQDGTPSITRAIDGSCISRKDYDSVYIELENRKRLIASLESDCGEFLFPGVKLRAVQYDENARRFRCYVQSASSINLDEIVARAIIFAGGRFGPISWSTTFFQVPCVFRRIEIGVRLVQSNRDFFLQNERFRDPKLIPQSPDDRYSWRTFCCCRDGEVVETVVQGIVSVSGRADGAITGKSNVGFNLRVTNPNLAALLWPDATWPTKEGCSIESDSLHTFLAEPGKSGIARAVGTGAAALLADGLRHLCSAYPCLRDSPCEIVAPAIEGVGHYPALDGMLRAGAFPLWVAGDATGMFRGLTAAMVSGYFVALQAERYMEG